MNYQTDAKKQAVQAQFGKHAEQYVTSQTHAKGEDLPLIVDWLQPKREWTVLDIATGGGHVARTLAPHVKWVAATDLTRPMLAAAARANREEGVENILYVQADAESLPFLDESFDLVTCRIAAHHFPHPAAFVREVERVLRPGGFFLFIDNVVPEDQEMAEWINRIEQMRDRSHVRCLAVSEWETLFSLHQLAAQKSRLRKKHFSFPQWVSRMAESREQEEAVEQCLLQAPEQVKAYLELVIEKNRVLTCQIDEWMVLCAKRESGE